MVSQRKNIKKKLLKNLVGIKKSTNFAVEFRFDLVQAVNLMPL